MARNYSRPPTSDPQAVATDRPSAISLGKVEKMLLEYALQQYENTNSNKKPVPLRRRTFARENNIPPTTVGDNLALLVRKELLDKDRVTGAYMLTDEGVKCAQMQRLTGSQPTRAAYRAVRDKTLSQHALRFELVVKERTFFHVDDLKKIGDVSIPAVMQNWSYHRVKIDDCELRVFPNKIVLYMQEFVDSNVEETQLLAIDKASQICSKLKSIGLIISGIKLDAAHWARVKSILADALVLHLGKYWYQLKDGSKFWIDFSGNSLEDETDSNKLRSRVDEFIEDLPKSKAVFSDVDTTVVDVKQMKEVMALMLAHDVNMVRLQTGAFKPLPKDQKEVTNYFG